MNVNASGGAANAPKPNESGPKPAEERIQKIKDDTAAPKSADNEQSNLNNGVNLSA